MLSIPVCVWLRGAYLDYMLPGFKSLLSWSVFCILLVYIDDPECCDSMLNKSSLLNRSLSGKPYSEIVWRIDSFQAFGERKFDELIYQPIGY